MEDIDAKTAQALAAEAQARDFAFLADDVPTPLCGTAVFPLDLRSLNILTHAGNRFIVGGRAEVEDVRMILWLLSPLYVPVEPPRRLNWWQRLWEPFAVPPMTQKQAFIESLPEMDEAEAVAEMRAWIDATFYDSPPRKAAPDGMGPVLDEPVASFIASWVDLLASEYGGWTKEYIVGTAQKRGLPLTQLYQFQRCCTRRRDPDHPFCSAAVVRLHAEWLLEDEPKATAPAPTPS